MEFINFLGDLAIEALARVMLNLNVQTAWKHKKSREQVNGQTINLGERRNGLESGRTTTKQ